MRLSVRAAKYHRDVATLVRTVSCGVSRSSGCFLYRHGWLDGEHADDKKSCKCGFSR